MSVHFIGEPEGEEVRPSWWTSPPSRLSPSNQTWL